MDPAAFRHLFDYHFAENRALWERCQALSDAQFVAETPYSLGSVRNHLVHLVNVDEAWFSGISGLPWPEPLDPAAYADRAALRARWDAVEAMMRAFLDKLTPAQLAAKPFPPGEEDAALITWQVLLQVANHGTDHRAQVLRLLHDAGIKTTSQDYVFYVYNNPL